MTRPAAGGSMAAAEPVDTGVAMTPEPETNPLPRSLAR